MTHREKSSYEGCFSSYKFQIRLFETKLTLGAEHSRTKQLYQAEFDQDAINTVTQNICETCEQLFELLEEVIRNDGKCANKSLDIVEEETKLVLNVNLMVLFGRTSRQFKIQIQLNNVQLDDITRLTSIINEPAEKIEELQCTMADRFNRAITLVSAWENDFQFQCLSPTDYVKVSNDARTITDRAQVVSSNVKQSFGLNPNTPSFSFGDTCTNLAPANQQVVATTTRGFLSSVNRRYQLVRFKIQFSNTQQQKKVCIGVVHQPKNKNKSQVIPSTDAWALNVVNGSIEHSYFNDRPYTWSLDMFRWTQEKRGHNIVNVDLLLDALHRRLAFRIENQTEDHWAFHLPQHLAIDQLYPLVFFNFTDVSVSIAI